jgi:hypothetical protein
MSANVLYLRALQQCKLSTTRIRDTSPQEARSQSSQQAAVCINTTKETSTTMQYLATTAATMRTPIVDSAVRA